MGHRKSRALFDDDEIKSMPPLFVAVSKSIHRFCTLARTWYNSRGAEEEYENIVHNEEGQWYGVTTKGFINTAIRRQRFLSLGALELPEEGEDEYVFRNKVKGTELRIKIKPDKTPDYAKRRRTTD